MTVSVMTALQLGCRLSMPSYHNRHVGYQVVHVFFLSWVQPDMLTFKPAYISALIAAFSQILAGLQVRLAAASWAGFHTLVPPVQCHCISVIIPFPLNIRSLPQLIEAH